MATGSYLNQNYYRSQSEIQGDLHIVTSSFLTGPRSKQEKCNNRTEMFKVQVILTFSSSDVFSFPLNSRENDGFFLERACKHLFVFLEKENSPDSHVSQLKGNLEM
ncbi:hypothetical protein TNCV_4429441 [Trichonephila clavipes]|nr:hypothetical protein TNCV_4429441 [Trichonephila clavipes]